MTVRAVHAGTSCGDADVRSDQEVNDAVANRLWGIADGDEKKSSGEKRALQYTAVVSLCLATLVGTTSPRRTEDTILALFPIVNNVVLGFMQTLGSLFGHAPFRATEHTTQAMHAMQ